MGRARDRRVWPCEEAAGLPRLGRAEALETLEIGGEAGVAGTSSTAALSWLAGEGRLLLPGGEEAEDCVGARSVPESFCSPAGVSSERR